LKDITPKRYQECLNDLKDRGYSDSTREGIHRTGRMIFRKALEFELIKKDPTEFAYLKKDKKTLEQLEEEELPRYLEKEELALFLKTAKDLGLEHDYLAFLILSYSGIRVGELIALKWKDIDFCHQHHENVLQSQQQCTEISTWYSKDEKIEKENHCR
jgi:integrase